MELWRTQAGAGKTEAVLTQIAQSAADNPLARIWVVLPSNRQRAAFRLRLLEHLREAQSPAFNVELFNFYSLNRRLLNLLRVPVRSLNRGARQSVLRRVAATSPLTQFESVANMPGFAQAIGRLISELKQAQIEPAAFTAAAITQKDRELAGIYSAYQSRLQDNDLVDTEGEAWLSLAKLQEAPPTWNAQISLLVVDGFDQFTGVQAQLVRVLSQHAGRTIITLTHVPGREEGVGRRFTSAQQALGAVDVRDLPDYPHPQPAVRHLLTHAFHLTGSIPPMDADAARTVTLIEAHSPASEATEVIRSIKQRLVLDRTPPDDVMVVLRDWPRYQPTLSSAAAEFGVPLSLQSGMPLGRHPLMAVIDGLLTLRDSDFSFANVMDLLRSPYILLEDMMSDLLAKIELAARRFNLRSGRESWEAALERGCYTTIDHNGLDIPAILTHAEAASAIQILGSLFDALPAPDTTGALRSFVWQLEELIGVDPDSEDDADAKLNFTLNIAQQVRNDSRVGDDLAALHAIKNTLKEMLLTEDLLALIDGNPSRAVRWSDFTADFRAAANAAELGSSPDRSGRVLVTTASEARGSAHAHVYILGLAEGIFPAPLSADPLYLDTESARLTHAGHPILRAAADRVDDDSLFFEMLAQAQTTLTLSRPTLDGGQLWQPSALWHAVTAHIPHGTAPKIRTSPGKPPLPEDAASLGELSGALQNSAALAAYLRIHDPLRAAHIARAQTGELGRYHLAETGESPESPADVADLRSAAYNDLRLRVRTPNYRWSPSSINALASCAYRIFAEKLLGLDELENPTEGTDAALEGSLMHRILEGTYAGFRTPETPISPENCEDALNLMQHVASEVFADAVANRELVPGPIWEQQKKLIERHLVDFIRLDFSDESPIVQNFGADRRWTLVTEKKFGDEDHRPMTLGSGAERFSLAGSIDRVDCIDDGETLRLIVIDYKRSMSDISAGDVRKGLSTQIVLYSLVLEKLLAAPDSPERQRWFSDLGQPRQHAVVGGLFWSMRSRKPLNVLSDDKNSSMEDIRQATLSGIIERIQDVRSGDFRPLPAKVDDGKCAKYCAFSDLCRVCELTVR